MAPGEAGTRPARPYREDIDGLRAIAVLAVVANHFSASLLPGGYLGVDIFFVISGFVITRSLGERPPQLGRFLNEFYARRIRRILPALLFCVATTGLLTMLVNPFAANSLRSGVFALFGLANLHFYRAAADYFAATAKLDTFTHTWSLGVEEQFYFLYPLLAWLLVAAGRSAPRAKPFLLGIGTLSALSLAAFVVFQPTRPVAVFYLPWFRFWELGLGCLLAHVDRGPSRFAAAAITAAASILAICLAAPESAIVAATVGAVAATGALLHWGDGKVWSYPLLTARPMRFVGRISYSLYLWHWPVLVLSRWSVGVHWWSAPLQFAAMLGIAWLSFRYIETPWRRPRSGTGPARTILVGLAGSGAVAGLLLVLIIPLDGRLFLGARPSEPELGAQSIVNPYRPRGSSAWEGSACVLQTNQEADRAIDPARCTMAAPGAQRRLLVIGNSYAPAFVRAFDPLISRGYAVTVIAALGASPGPSVSNSSRWPQTNAALWHRIYPDLARTLRAGDVVLLANDLAGVLPDPQTPASAHDIALLHHDLIAMSGDLSRRGVRLAMLDSLPLLREAACPPEMAYRQWYAPFGPACEFKSRTYHLARRHPIHAMLADLQARGEVIPIDLFDLFCPGETCGFAVPGIALVYRDEYTHPSVQMMPRVGREIARSFAADGLLDPRLPPRNPG